MSEVHEIADGIYRIAAFNENDPITFSQFLVLDEKPLLFHTGQRALFPETLEAVKKVIDPAELRYISWSHLEADECGAANEFLAAAPHAEPIHGEVGVMLSVNDFFSRPVTSMKDGEVLDLGRHKLRFLITPHVPHAWDAILLYEETTGTLFASDLFTQFGKSVAMTDSDMVEQAIQTHKVFPDYLPVGPRTGLVFDRLEALEPKVIAGHHAPAFTGNAVQALRDLRTELFKLAEASVEALAEDGGPSEGYSSPSR
ncbi:MAG TPA: MBL fold metallo-hydrolase [Dehalococcoidia bacterium]|jgi:flavorubredoxin|nr:MBL fold metallo-hydrolase [Dehalococcoidia bacterium]